MVQTYEWLADLPNTIIEFIKTFAYLMIQTPIRWWGGLPDWAQWIIIIFITLFAIMIGALVWKNRDEWRHVHP